MGHGQNCPSFVQMILRVRHGHLALDWTSLSPSLGGMLSCFDTWGTTYPPFKLVISSNLTHRLYAAYLLKTEGYPYLVRVRPTRDVGERNPSEVYHPHTRGTESRYITRFASIQFAACLSTHTNQIHLHEGTLRWLSRFVCPWPRSRGRR